MCDAAQQCADLTVSDRDDEAYYKSFDLHYLCSNNTWECVQYYDFNFDTSAFNVPDSDAVAVFGYTTQGWV